MTSPCKTSGPGTPLVSIITPVYNRVDYLGETIESVLAQTLTNWELLIIDDGSETDECRKIAEKYCQQDNRILYIYRPHAGISTARNHGIAHARGKYLGFLDSDDRYRPNALSSLVRALQLSQENVKLAYADFIKYFQDENRFHHTRVTPPKPRPNLYLQFLVPGGNPIAPCTCLIERSALDITGGFDSRFDSIEDRELWSRIIQYYDIVHIPEPISIYRKHSSQETKNRNKASKRVLNDLQAFTFFSSLPIEEWCSKSNDEINQAKTLDTLAMILLKRQNTPFDTALHLLRIAQKKHPSQNRQSFIDGLETKIPQILKKLYDSSERILTPEV